MDDKAIIYPDGEPPIPDAVGRFEIVERAPGGRGSQAAIYRARDPELGREVAVKVLGNRFDSFASSLLSVLVGERDMEEIRREAELLASLDHPNILSLLEAGEDPVHGPYAVMEWIPGGDLKARIEGADGGRLPLEEALGIAGDILAALEAAHGAGVIHLDIKPGNILLGGRGETRLADFGIAGDGADDEVLPGRGTLGYMAPEQDDPQQASRVGPATDIYGMGVVLFEMLAGRQPAPGEDVRELRPEVPASVAEALARALQPDPADRFSSAREMATALTGG